MSGEPIRCYFCHLHGSFFTEDRFKDIDIAVYLDPLPPSLLEAELELEAKLSNVVKRYPVDIRILNNASLSFRYNVIKNGQPIVVNNDNIRSDFVEATLSYYPELSLVAQVEVWLCQEPGKPEQ